MQDKGTSSKNKALGFSDFGSLPALINSMTLVNHTSILILVIPF